MLTPLPARRLGRTLRLVLLWTVLSFGIMGLSCDSDAQSAFRQAATANIGSGVKQFFGGDPEQAAETIIHAAIDGMVASIEQAGDGPSTGR